MYIHYMLVEVIPDVVVVIERVEEGGLGACTSPNTDTATTLNMYPVPGSRPVTLAAATLSSTVTFLSSPPRTKITWREGGGMPLLLASWNQEMTTHVDPICSPSGADGADGATAEERRRR